MAELKEPSIEEYVEDLKQRTTNPTLKKWLSEPPLSLEEVRNIVASHRSSTILNGQDNSDTCSSNGQV